MAHPHSIGPGFHLNLVSSVGSVGYQPVKSHRFHTDSWFVVNVGHPLQPSITIGVTDEGSDNSTGTIHLSHFSFETETSGNPFT